MCLGLKTSIKENLQYILSIEVYEQRKKFSIAHGIRSLRNDSSSWMELDWSRKIKPLPVETRWEVVGRWSRKAVHVTRLYQHTLAYVCSCESCLYLRKVAGLQEKSLWRSIQRGLVCSRVTWGFVTPSNFELRMTPQVDVTLSVQWKRTFLFLLWRCMHFNSALWFDDSWFSPVNSFARWEDKIHEDNLYWRNCVEMCKLVGATISTIIYTVTKSCQPAIEIAI